MWFIHANDDQIGDRATRPEAVRFVENKAVEYWNNLCDPNDPGQRFPGVKWEGDVGTLELDRAEVRFEIVELE
jgi:hypothetical protein